MPLDRSFVNAVHGLGGRGIATWHVYLIPSLSLLPMPYLSDPLYLDVCNEQMGSSTLYTTLSDIHRIAYIDQHEAISTSTERHARR